MRLFPSFARLKHGLCHRCCISALIRPVIVVKSRSRIYSISPLWRRRFLPARRSPTTWSWPRRVAVYVRRWRPWIVRRLRMPWLRGRSILIRIARSVRIASGYGIIDVMRRVCGRRAGRRSIPVVVNCGSLGAPRCVSTRHYVDERISDIVSWLSMVPPATPASSLVGRRHEPREQSDACANVPGWRQVSEEVPVDRTSRQ